MGRGFKSLLRLHVRMYAMDMERPSLAKTESDPFDPVEHERGVINVLETPRIKAILALFGAITTAACTTTSYEGRRIEYGAPVPVLSGERYCEKVKDMLSRSSHLVFNETIDSPSGRVVMQAIREPSGKRQGTVSITTPRGITQRIDCLR